MPFRVLSSLMMFAALAAPQTESIGDRTQRLLIDLLKLNTTNPPGAETLAAEYLKRTADDAGIPADVIGADPKRLNFVARLKGTGAQKPLLLMAHTDVVPADRSQWSVDPFGAVIKDGILYGRGAEDVKSLLAAEMAVMIELKRRNVKLKRDVILLAEADEEAGSTGITWMIANAWAKIDAEFALNEFGWYNDYPSGDRVFQIQTTEKVPTRVKLTARGVAGHGSLPRADNPVAHLARAITRLVDAEQPVALNATTRRYFEGMSLLPGNEWLKPLLPRLDTTEATRTADQIRDRNPEFNAMLRTTISPTMLEAGVKINVIPNTAQAQVDVRRLPTETAADVLERFRRIINDPAVSVEPAESGPKPATEPSSLTSPLYRAMEEVFVASHPKGRVLPLLMRGATDGSYLRAKGIAVYGVPLFAVEGQPRWHGNDERISLANLRAGSELLWKLVLRVAAE